MGKRVLIIVAVVAAVLCAATGCAQPTSSNTESLRLGSSSSPQMRVMAQIYAGALRNSGTAVETRVTTGDDRELLDAMDRADLDLFPAFSGELLSVLAPTAGDKTDGSPDAVYAELNRSLPQGVSVGDPTPVVGTTVNGVVTLDVSPKPTDSGATVPPAQVLVPVLRGAAISRDDAKTVNKVAGEITTTDLAAMAARVAGGADPHEVAVTWLGEHGL